MDFSYSADEERFRAELRAWLEANPPGAGAEELEDWVAYAKALAAAARRGRLVRHRTGRRPTAAAAPR